MIIKIWKKYNHWCNCIVFIKYTFTSGIIFWTNLVQNEMSFVQNNNYCFSIAILIKISIQIFKSYITEFWIIDVVKIRVNLNSDQHSDFKNVLVLNCCLCWFVCGQQFRFKKTLISLCCTFLYGKCCKILFLEICYCKFDVQLLRVTFLKLYFNTKLCDNLSIITRNVFNCMSVILQIFILY